MRKFISFPHYSLEEFSYLKISNHVYKNSFIDQIKLNIIAFLVIWGVKRFLNLHIGHNYKYKDCIQWWEAACMLQVFTLLQTEKKQLEQFHY